MGGIISNLDSKMNLSKLIVQALEKGWKPFLIIYEGDETEYAGEPLLHLSLFLINMKK
jgi:hypothetical protein